MTNLRIMSNNIWWSDGNKADWEAIGANCSAEARAPGLFRAYQELQPDLLGLQECSAKMAHLLMSLFAENRMPYAMLWGRDTPIVYRTDRLELVDSEVLIYPEEIPGLEGSFNNARTKSYCAALFRLKETGQLLCFATTHLWWKSEDPNRQNYQPHSEAAKAWQLGKAIDCVEAFQQKYGCPAVIVGDCNTWPTGKAIQNALRRGFVHGHDAAIDFADETQGMHYCYADGYTTTPYPEGFGQSLDHILIRGELTVRRFSRYSPDYYMPLSDHFPVWIDGTL